MEPETFADRVEHTRLPRIQLLNRSQEVLLEAYVNAYIVGPQPMLMDNGRQAIPLYYLSLVAMKGQGTTLQGLFASLVSTQIKPLQLEGVGPVVLAHHQARLAHCNYTLHWNYEQAEVAPMGDLHGVIESRMLTIYDPVRALANKHREHRVSKNQASKRSKKDRASLSTLKSSKAQNSLLEQRNREQHPLFLLLVPPDAQRISLAQQLHLAFLDMRVPWPLDPSWAAFLWERGLSAQEIEPLQVWCATPPAEEDDADQVVPFIADAYFCRPKPAHIACDIQGGLVEGRIGTHLHTHLIALPTSVEEPTSPPVLSVSVTA